MKRNQMLGLAIVALALAGLASLVAAHLARGGARTPPRATVVVAAAVALTPGAALQAGDLQLVALPPDALPRHVYHSIAALVGQVITQPAVPRQVIVGEMMAAAGSGGGLPPLIPAGMRAVSVKVNDVVSVAGFAVPGTHVDVLLTGNPAQNDDPAEVTTITLLSNVQVLAAGQQMEQVPNGKPETVTVITLLVDPAGAEKLALADGYGHIQLALRNALDHDAAAAPPLHNGALFGGRSTAPEPARAAAAPPRRTTAAVAQAAVPVPPVWSIDLINGDKHQALNFTHTGGK